MKKWLIGVLVCLCFIACGPTKKVSDNYGSGAVTSMKLIELSYFYPSQIDSVIIVERLKPLEQWHKNVLVDRETQQPFEQYIFIRNGKDGTYNYGVEKVFQTDSLYKYKKVRYGTE